MDDDFSPISDPKANILRAVTEHEASLRRLHKQLRRTHCQEASFALLEAADAALAAARALAAEMPARHPPEPPHVRPELYIA